MIYIINDERYFASVPEFINLKIDSRDTASQYVQALKIFQEILRFHDGDKEPDALVDANLKRLNFVREKVVFTDKDKLYEAALKRIADRFDGQKAGAAAAIELAQFYAEKGYEKDDEIDEENSVKHTWFQKAEEVAEKIVKTVG